MKILIYENSSGFSSYTYKLCNALIEQGEDVSYLTLENNDEIENIDSRVKVLPYLIDYDKSKKNSIKWLLNRVYVSLYCIIKRNLFCKNKEYDAISIQSTIPIFDQFFLRSFCKKNKNVVYTVHDVIPPIKSFFWSRRSLKRIYTIVPKLIVHTDGNKRQLINEFGFQENKIHVVHHGTDIEYNKMDMETCRCKFGVNQEKTTLLFYGLIREQKGLDVLIKALKGLDNIQLVIAGNMPHGENFNKYKRLITENRIDTVELIQYLPNEWTDELFQACDVVCLPYKYFYSQSGVFMQAIKYRRPVVVSDVSSFSEYINKYNMGILCKPDDVSDLHDKIIILEKLLKKGGVAFEVGLEKAAQENSWMESANKYIKIFDISNKHRE